MPLHVSSYFPTQTVSNEDRYYVLLLPLDILLFNVSGEVRHSRAGFTLPSHTHKGLTGNDAACNLAFLFVI